MSEAFFTYKNATLHCERVSLETIATEFGTPCYVYSRAAIEQAWHDFDRAFRAPRHRICYAVKANSNIAILNLLARLNSGFDIVSAGELERVRQGGGDLSKVVFSGVGKTPRDIEAALKASIRCIHIESAAELELIEQLARQQGRLAQIGFRLNPDVATQTHRYIRTGHRDDKFGISLQTAHSLMPRIEQSDHLKLVGVACHIGSQIEQPQAFGAAARRLVAFADDLEQGLSGTFEHIDFGGGFAVGEGAPQAAAYTCELEKAVGERPWEIIIEPGRAIVADAGVLLTQVIGLKREARNFMIVDAGMNDFMRTALYQAQHPWQAVRMARPASERFAVVGPVCESADCFSEEAELGATAGDFLVLCQAGAYGMSMASNYNSRGRPAEVLVDQDQACLIRKRETSADLIAGECLGLD